MQDKEPPHPSSGEPDAGREGTDDTGFAVFAWFSALATVFQLALGGGAGK